MSFDGMNEQQQSVPQPRYTRNYKSIAKRDEVPLFCFDIDARHLEGSRSTSIGVLSRDSAEEIIRKIRKYFPEVSA